MRNKFNEKQTIQQDMERGKIPQFTKIHETFEDLEIVLLPLSNL